MYDVVLKTLAFMVHYEYECYVVSQKFLRLENFKINKFASLVKEWIEQSGKSRNQVRIGQTHTASKEFASNSIVIGVW